MMGREPEQQRDTLLAIDVSAARIVWRHERTERSVTIKARAEFGLLVYLAQARISDARQNAGGGFRTAHEVLAEAPGFDRVTQVASVGKRMSDLTRSLGSIAPLIIDTPAGPTSSPWRVALPPETIRIIDTTAFDAFLAARLALAAHERSQPQASREEDDVGVGLAAVESEIEHGAVRADVLSILDVAAKTGIASFVARAERLRATLLVRAGKLAEAERSIEVALENAGTDNREAALALAELGAVRYRQGAFPGAHDCFVQGLARLSLVSGGVDDLDGHADEVGDDQADGLRLQVEILAPTAAGTAPATTRARIELLIRRGLAEMRLRKYDSARTSVREARDLASLTKQRDAVCLASAIDRRIELRESLINGVLDAKRATTISRELAVIGASAPVTHAMSLLLVRRYLLEALYAAALYEEADRLAQGIIEDALDLNSLKDADAVVRLLAQHQRDDVRRLLPRKLLCATRDRID